MRSGMRAFVSAKLGCGALMVQVRGPEVLVLWEPTEQGQQGWNTVAKGCSQAQLKPIASTALK